MLYVGPLVYVDPMRHVDPRLSLDPHGLVPTGTVLRVQQHSDNTDDVKHPSNRVEGYDYATPSYAAPAGGYAVLGYAAPGYAASGYAALGYTAPGYVAPPARGLADYHSPELTSDLAPQRTGLSAQNYSHANDHQGHGAGQDLAGPLPQRSLEPLAPADPQAPPAVLQAPDGKARRTYKRMKSPKRKGTPKPVTYTAQEAAYIDGKMSAGMKPEDIAINLGQSRTADGVVAKYFRIRKAKAAAATASSSAVSDQ